MKSLGIFFAVGSVVASAFGVSGAAAQAGSATGSYAGKTLSIVSPNPPGGGSDALVRLTARFIGPHLPGNPSVVVRNMPGAGGLLATNYLFNVAPRNGLTIGVIEQSIHAQQLFNAKELKADVRQFNWLGRITSNNAVLFARADHKVQSIEDAFRDELVVSATGLSSQMRWTILKKLTGIKFKLIVGHQGSAQAMLAMERGEVDALSMPWIVFRVERAHWLRERKVNLLLQTGLERAADLSHVPRVVDLARDAEQREMLELFALPEKVGRSLVAPPQTPPAQVAELRAAFDAMLKDPAFNEELATRQIKLEPLDGVAMQEFILGSFRYAPALIERAEALAKPE